MTPINRLFTLIVLLTQQWTPLLAADTPAVAKLRIALQKAHPETEFSRIEPTPMADLFEVWMGPNVAFVTSANPRFFLFGHLFDTETLTDLTAPKLAQAERIERQSAPATESAVQRAAFSTAQLPLQDAIKTVRGRGTRQLFVFSDPACMYCRRLAPELDKLNDITIWTFVLPLQGIDLPLSIWCAPDRDAAWQRVMSGNGSAPGTSVSCPNPLSRNRALAEQLGIQGTPTLFFEDGSRIDGFASASAIDEHFTSTNSRNPL